MCVYMCISLTVCVKKSTSGPWIFCFGVILIGKKHWQAAKKKTIAQASTKKWRFCHQRKNNNGIETMRLHYSALENKKQLLITMRQNNDGYKNYYDESNSKKKKEKKKNMSLNENKYLYVFLVCILCMLSFMFIFYASSPFSRVASMFHIYCRRFQEKGNFYKFCYYFNIESSEYVWLSVCMCVCVCGCVWNWKQRRKFYIFFFVWSFTLIFYFAISVLSWQTSLTYKFIWILFYRMRLK